MKRYALGGVLILVCAGIYILAPPPSWPEAPAVTRVAALPDGDGSSGELEEVTQKEVIQACLSPIPAKPKESIGKEAQDLWVRRDRFEFRPSPALTL